MGNRLCYQKGEFAMKCFLCKGQLEEQLTNFMIDVKAVRKAVSEVAIVNYQDSVA